VGLRAVLRGWGACHVVRQWVVVPGSARHKGDGVSGNSGQHKLLGRGWLLALRLLVVRGER